MQCLKSAAVHTTFIGLRLTRRPDALPGLHTPARTTRSARCYAEAEAPASSTGFWTIAAPQEHVAEVKKSRFLAYAWPITSSQQAKQLLADNSDPDASHNCYAWKLGSEARSSDDGEPSGTGGKPILGAIEGDSLNGVCVLVTRHYGGIKLGAGGLVRAYGGAARDCLRAAPKTFVKQQVQVQVNCRYELLGAVYRVLTQHGAAVMEQEYTSDGDVQLTAQVEGDQAAAVQQGVADATQGRVAARVIGS